MERVGAYGDLRSSGQQSASRIRLGPIFPPNWWRCWLSRLAEALKDASHLSQVAHPK